MNYWTCLINPKTMRLTLLFSLIFPICALAADFGVANWGMTSAEVKQLENRVNLTPFGADSYLIFSVNLPNIDIARIVYQFDQDRLTEGRFIFRTENPFDVSRAVAQYQQIKSMITNQYGPPNADQILTPASQDKSLGNRDIANDLASDRAILKSNWRSPNAIINHQLAWNENQPHHQLHYIPLETMPSAPDASAF
ncbi:hypothetical protein [Reinekea sp. G2M2-21]|uniref:hypothetical protein n=1 Tax=Reinekea sp. G2M2-21 TaxID=2788942 RepID=UPI0018A8B5CB|nr:hypothetical protein [Reinekea sp. G2M2-21]